MSVSRREAQEIISTEMRKLSGTLDDRTAFKSGANEAARSLDWWMKYDDPESSTTHRNIALLRSYDRIAGPKLWAAGIPLSDRQRLDMDRSVMRRFCQAELVRWIHPEKGEPYCEVTHAGRNELAS